MIDSFNFESCSLKLLIYMQIILLEHDFEILVYSNMHIICILQVYIIDAKDFESEPIAIIILPSRVPYGFHGAFMPFFNL